MDTDRDWIALLDEDEDDFLFWQHGFQRWAGDIELKWFTTAESFLSKVVTGTKPSAVVLDGVVPPGEEEVWLSNFLVNDCCQNTPIFMLTEQLKEDDRQTYLTLGAADYLIKPTNREELQRIIAKVTGYEPAASVKQE